MTAKGVLKIAGLLTVLGGSFVGWIWLAGKVEGEVRKEIKKAAS